MVTEALAIVPSRVMSTSSDSRESAARGTTVSFGAHFATSDQFDAIFKEGMGLVERTAAYLDGAGRKEARALRGPVAVLYATESMRLTTRLLELASWLMIRRALKEGEITPEEARAKRERVKLRGPGRPSHIKGFADLPVGLKRLVDSSYGLSDRIFQLDRAMEVVPEKAPAIENPVSAQVTRLEEAFARPHRRLAGR
jgi:regulator of CtrA degradation